MYCSSEGDISKPWWRLTKGKERVGFGISEALAKI